MTVNPILLAAPVKDFIFLPRMACEIVKLFTETGTSLLEHPELLLCYPDDQQVATSRHIITDSRLWATPMKKRHSPCASWRLLKTLLSPCSSKTIWSWELRQGKRLILKQLRQTRPSWFYLGLILLKRGQWKSWVSSSQRASKYIRYTTRSRRTSSGISWHPMTGKNRLQTLLSYFHL